MKEYTISARFLLRPLGIVKKNETLSTSNIRNFGFVNAFIKDLNHETEYEYPLYLLFKQEQPILSFRDFVNEEYDRGYLLEDYDYPEGFIVMVYDYPNEYREDYNKVMDGKYSQTSKKFQNHFPETMMLEGVMQESVYSKVFNRNDKFRKGLEVIYGIELDKDSEVWRSPYMDEVPKDLEGKIPSETLDITKYVNNG